MNARNEEQRKLLMEALDKSARSSQPIDWSEIEDDWALTSPTFYVSSRTVWRWLLVLVIVLALALLPARSQAAGCEEVPAHHTAGSSVYWSRLMTAGTVKFNKVSGDVIVFLRIAECGGRYLIAIWRGGQFTTHFLTSWGYVKSYVTGFAAGTFRNLLVRSWWFILVPCPGTWDVFQRPCPASGGTS